MVVKSRLDLGRSFLAALLTPTLLQLLGGYLLAIALLTWLTLSLVARSHPPAAPAPQQQGVPGAGHRAGH
ncbi:hypothetical protein [Cyanobium gracile]|uniref:Uncharacterized protein n=1 Tax=Cyanobium gracile UHCC 0281 TaxID=3110309 RepID=A0ABU5SYS4_9CYAN|nr:hypothetical protein [Cyanobium gracile]MEA5443480.1 hypothetical protein [Cyanobium gracile UHCC 0281]